MSDIELVIKLDEEYIKQIDRIKFLIGGIEDRSLQVNVINAIKNGTALPKGHGVLKDADELLKHAHTIGTSNYCEYDVVYVETIKEAKPIIEANKEK